MDAVLDARKLWTGEEARDAHLKSEDFLDVETHPEITVRGDAVDALGCNEMVVEGELTIRGTTRDVVLRVRYLGGRGPARSRGDRPA